MQSWSREPITHDLIELSDNKLIRFIHDLEFRLVLLLVFGSFKFTYDLTQLRVSSRRVDDLWVVGSFGSLFRRYRSLHLYNQKIILNIKNKGRLVKNWSLWLINLELNRLIAFWLSSSSISVWIAANCMSALAAISHEIDEQSKHRVLPVPVGDSKIAFFLFVNWISNFQKNLNCVDIIFFLTLLMLSITLFM